MGHDGTDHRTTEHDAAEQGSLWSPDESCKQSDASDHLDQARQDSEPLGVAVPLELFDLPVLMGDFRAASSDPDETNDRLRSGNCDGPTLMLRSRPAIPR